MSKLLDEDECKRLIDHGTAQDLVALRGRLVQRKKLIEAQLADDTAALREARTELIEGGMHPREADLRAMAEGDHDWRVRCGGLQRLIDGWLARINVRIHQLVGGQPQHLAVAIPEAGSSSQRVVVALNALLERGCKVAAFCVVDADLVIVSTQPKE